MRVHGVFVRHSVAIMDRGRTEKNAQRIACQLLEGRARDVPICCKHLSTKGGSGTEGCGGIRRSRIAWLFRLCTESFKSVKERTYVWLVTLYVVTPILRKLAILLGSVKKQLTLNRGIFFHNLM